jgi:hypothetical protein
MNCPSCILECVRIRAPVTAAAIVAALAATALALSVPVTYPAQIVTTLAAAAAFLTLLIGRRRATANDLLVVRLLLATNIATLGFACASLSEPVLAIPLWSFALILAVQAIAAQHKGDTNRRP